MNKSFLITRPKHEIVVHYLFVWSEEVIKEAKKQGVKVLDLSKKRACKKQTISMLKKMKPELVFLNGHGGHSCITGHNNEPIIEKDSAGVLESKIVYMRSCQTGKLLGPESIKKGALAYVGYKDDFILLHDEEKIGNPLNDEIAGLFLKPSNYVIISILKGHSVGDSHKRSIRKIRENIQSLSSSESSKSYLLPYLMWNMVNQVCLGDSGAKF